MRQATKVGGEMLQVRTARSMGWSDGWARQTQSKDSSYESQKSVWEDKVSGHSARSLISANTEPCLSLSKIVKGFDLHPAVHRDVFAEAPRIKQRLFENTRKA